MQSFKIASVVDAPASCTPTGLCGGIIDVDLGSGHIVVLRPRTHDIGIWICKKGVIMSIRGRICEINKYNKEDAQ